MQRAELEALSLSRWTPVLVEWIDSASVNSWTDERDFEAAMEKGTSHVLAASLYWGVSAESLILVAHHDEKHENVTLAMQIPICAVLSVQPLAALVKD